MSSAKWRPYCPSLKALKMLSDTSPQRQLFENIYKMKTGSLRPQVASSYGIDNILVVRNDIKQKHVS